MGNSQDLEGRSVDSVARQFVAQHCTLEKSVLVWFVAFKILRRFHIEPHGRLGRTLAFLFVLATFLGLPLILTAILGQWASAPIGTWIVIAVLFGLVTMSYGMYLAIGHKVSSLSLSVLDAEALQRQIIWDRFWFSLRVSGPTGALAAAGMVASLIVINRQTPGVVIPAGNLLIIGFLSYQIGETGCNNLLMCFEARNLAGMKHALYRFNPLDTYTLQEAVTGYNQFGLVTSFMLTVFIACSAILLPDAAFLANPVWLGLLLAVYAIVVLAVVLPRYFVQEIVRKAKQRDLTPLRQNLNAMLDQLSDQSKEEYEQMLRLEKIQEMISQAPESCLPASTIGRLFSTLVLPTITFVLAVLGETYLAALFRRIFNFGLAP